MVAEKDHTGFRQQWGGKDAKIQLKSGQEPSVANVQTMVQEVRPGMVIPSDSPMGESQSNGRVEDAIKRVQEKTRTWRHQVEHGIGCKIPGDSLDGGMGGRIVAQLSPRR